MVIILVIATKIELSLFCHSRQAIANTVTLIGREFSTLVYIFEFLIETHRSNRYVGKLLDCCFERNFPRLTEERYSNSHTCGVQYNSSASIIKITNETSFN